MRDRTRNERFAGRFDAQCSTLNQVQFLWVGANPAMNPLDHRKMGFSGYAGGRLRMSLAATLDEARPPRGVWSSTVDYWERKFISATDTSVPSRHRHLKWTAGYRIVYVSFRNHA